jgi:hypothetical protein
MTIHAISALSSVAATRLTPNGIHSGMDITLQNINDDGYIYIGGSSTVSPTDYGFRISPNNAFSIELAGRDSIWATCSVDPMSIAVFSVDLERSA